MSNYITIGMDLGNRKHAVCAIDAAAKVLWRRDVANTAEALEPFFKENAGATIAMESGGDRPRGTLVKQAFERFSGLLAAPAADF